MCSRQHRTNRDSRRLKTSMQARTSAMARLVSNATPDRLPIQTLSMSITPVVIVMPCGNYVSTRASEL
jgi:hypothetical protein